MNDPKVMGKFNAHFKSATGSELTYGADSMDEMKVRIALTVDAWGIDSLQWIKEWHD